MTATERDGRLTSFGMINLPALVSVRRLCISGLHGLVGCSRVSSDRLSEHENRSDYQYELITNVSLCAVFARKMTDSGMFNIPDKMTDLGMYIHIPSIELVAISKI